MIWKSRLLAQYPEIDHGSTSKSHGVLRFSEMTSPDEVISDRQTLLSLIGAHPKASFLMHQVHGDVVFKVTTETKGNVLYANNLLPEADALMSNREGVTLITRTADCVPVFFYDPKNRAIAVAHAGWKGTSQKIVQRVVASLKNDYNSDSSDLKVVIGPAICGQCYDNSTVTDNRVELFKKLYKEADKVVKEENGRITLDLPEANYVDLVNSGVLPENIERSHICTYQDGNWASYRARPQDLQYPIWNYLSLKQDR